MKLSRTKASITLEAARALVDAALTHAESIGKDVSIAVVDESGREVATARMDTANPSSMKIAIDKAYTAATTRISTHDWFKIVTTDEQLSVGALTGMERLITYGGGQIIEVDGQVIGGIGSSGGHWTGDTEITSAALTAVAQA
ncbi:GlcG/HbpS family heme-binding protein [Gordonia sp. DT30]|uniref:GlcG/HbpS family heme-binding protein n=1 Tax=unclassified Gordonia (in: high G+C Gram-positive bacteria) TaxID=2657482 RepID=UPI003CE7F288